MQERGGYGGKKGGDDIYLYYSYELSQYRHVIRLHFHGSAVGNFAGFLPYSAKFSRCGPKLRVAPTLLQATVMAFAATKREFEG